LQNVKGRRIVFISQKLYSIAHQKYDYRVHMHDLPSEFIDIELEIMINKQ